MPSEPRLKPDDELTLIGNTTLRLDTERKIRGAPIFTIDLDLPNVLTATLRHAPVVGSRIETVDEDAILSKAGVHSVVVGDDYVAVVAESFYQAKNALDGADIQLSGGHLNRISSAEYQTMLTEALDRADGIVIDDAPATSRTERDIVASYWAPFLAHATMEPMTCAARYENGQLELWASTQGPFLARAQIAKSLNIDPQAITIHRPFAGGGFGRRFFYDFCLQAAQIAHTIPGRPIKLIWTREQDMAHDYYRPAVAAKFRGNLDENGNLLGLTGDVAAASILDSNSPGSLEGKPDHGIFLGLVDCAYDIPEKQFLWHQQTSPVRIGMWRSVAHSQNAFFLETFVDECALAASADPAQYRLSLCGNNDRLRTVIEKVMEIANWDTAQETGRALGIAVAESYGSYVAQVAEVLVEAGTVKVENVWCVVDCGQAIDPGGVRAQMEGGIVYGLTAALFGEITLNDGVVEQTNFHDYRMLTLAQTPNIVVNIINSGAKLGGVGEPGLPPIAPAVGNAVFAAIGHRLRHLPFRIPRE